MLPTQTVTYHGDNWTYNASNSSKVTESYTQFQAYETGNPMAERMHRNDYLLKEELHIVYHIAC